MTQEVLETGAPPKRDGVPAWAAWAVGGVVLVVITLGYVLAMGDLVARTVAADRLLTQVEASEAAMKAAQDEFSTTIEPYSAGDMTDADREKLRADLADVAARGRDSIAAAGVGVGAVSVLPWHGNIADARDVYLRHNEAWVAYLDRASEDPDEWFREQADVNSTFLDARDPLVDAVTLFDLANAIDRIKAIYAESDESGGNGGGGGQSA